VGIWGSDTIISYSYYKKSISLAPTNQMNGKPNDVYGYAWWILKYKGLDIFYARGINGQYIIDIPAKDMVIVRLGQKWNKNKETGHHKEFYSYIDAALALGN